MVWMVVMRKGVAHQQKEPVSDRVTRVDQQKEPVSDCVTREEQIESREITCTATIKHDLFKNHFY